MTGVVITSLPNASTLTGAEYVPVVQSGTTVKTTVANMGPVGTFTQSGTGAVATTVQSKLRQIINVDDFIPVGTNTTTTDCSSYIQYAFNAAVAKGHARVQFAPSASYKCLSGLTLDVSCVGIEGNGAYLDFTALTSGTAFTITQSNGDANVRTALNHVNSIDHLFIAGPGGNYVNSAAVILEDNASPNTIAGGSFNHCSFLNWGNDVVNRSGAFCWTFNKCAFTLVSGVPTTYSITFPMLTNNGERNMFIDCFWYNRKYVVDCSNGNLSTMFIGCSIDGAGRAFTLTGGHTYMIGCHIEYVDDTDYWFSVSGENVLLSLENCEIISQSAKDIYSPFYSDSTAEMGGVVIKNCAFGIISSMTVPLIGGTGRAVVQNLVSLKSGTKPPAIAENQNYLAYGGFESANYTSEWTLASGAVRSSAQVRNNDTSNPEFTSITNAQSYYVYSLGSTTLAQWQTLFSGLTAIPSIGQLITATANGTLAGGATVTFASITNAQNYCVASLGSTTLAQWQALFSGLTAIPSVGQLITATASGTLAGSAIVKLLHSSNLSGDTSNPEFTSITNAQSYYVYSLGSTTLAQWQTLFSGLTAIPSIGQLITATASGTLAGGATVKVASIINSQNYCVVTLGGTTLAQWQALFSGLTAIPSVGQLITATASGTIPQSTTVKLVYSLSFPATGGTGVIPSAQLTMPVQPGQQVIGSLYYKVTGITSSSGTFYAQIDWRDKGGNSLGGSAALVATTNVSNWTLLRLNFLTPAPKGAVNYTLNLSLFGANAPYTPTGYIDDVILTAV